MSGFARLIPARHLYWNAHAHQSAD
jgi:hypothetical protein